jgi:hypothetical protein
MRRFLTKISIICLGFWIANCGGGPEQDPFPGATVDSLQRDSLALLDSLRSQVDGWEAQVLEKLNDLKVNCRVREDSLMANGQAMLEDSTFLLLRTEVRLLTDSLRHSILYGNTVADEAQVSTLEYINVLVAGGQTQADLQEALLLFCDYARVRQDSTPIIQ